MAFNTTRKSKTKAYDSESFLLDRTEKALRDLSLWKPPHVLDLVECLTRINKAFETYGDGPILPTGFMDRVVAHQESEKEPHEADLPQTD